MCRDTQVPGVGSYIPVWSLLCSVVGGEGLSVSPRRFDLSDEQLLSRAGQRGLSVPDDLISHMPSSRPPQGPRP